MAEPWILGIDISCYTFNFNLMDLQANTITQGVLPNDSAGFDALLDELKKYIPKLDALHACMEATGVYYQPLAHFLFACGVKVSVVNPIQIHAFGKSLLRRAKTDQGCPAHCPLRLETTAAFVGAAW